MSFSSAHIPLPDTPWTGNQSSIAPLDLFDMSSLATRIRDTYLDGYKRGFEDGYKSGVDASSSIVCVSDLLSPVASPNRNRFFSNEGLIAIDPSTQLSAIEGVAYSGAESAPDPSFAEPPFPDCPPSPEFRLSDFLHIPEWNSDVTTPSAEQGTAASKGALSPADLCATNQQPMSSQRPITPTTCQPCELVAGNSSESQIDTHIPPQSDDLRPRSPLSSKSRTPTVPHDRLDRAMTQSSADDAGVGRTMVTSPEMTIPPNATNPTAGAPLPDSERGTRSYPLAILESSDDEQHLSPRKRKRLALRDKKPSSPRFLIESIQVQSSTTGTTILTWNQTMRKWIDKESNASYHGTEILEQFALVSIHGIFKSLFQIDLEMVNGCWEGEDGLDCLAIQVKLSSVEATLRKAEEKPYTDCQEKPCLG